MNTDPLPEQDDAGLQSILRFTEYDPSHSMNMAVQGSRFIAFAIDYMIWIILFKIYNVIFALVLGAIVRLLGIGLLAIPAAIISTVVPTLLASLMYFGVLEILPMQGSLGKYLMGMVVSRDDGQPLAFSNVLIRSAVRSAFFAFPFLVMNLPPLFLLFHVGVWLDCLPGLLMGPKHKTLHDWAAGTVVVVRPKKEDAVLNEPLID